jgi:hypothetical protein
MKEKNIRLKHIGDETGIDYTRISMLVSGDQNLSQSEKAMFWSYFLSKGKGAD